MKPNRKHAYTILNSLLKSIGFCIKLKSNNGMIKFIEGLQKADPIP